MRNALIISMLAAAFVIATVTAQGQATAPWIGSWKVNVAKSSYSPGPAPKTGDCHDRVGSE